MIIHRELSSLEKDLGFSEKALYGVSYHRHEHYHSAKVPKGSGEFRELVCSGRVPENHPAPDC